MTSGDIGGFTSLTLSSRRPSIVALAAAGLAALAVGVSAKADLAPTESLRIGVKKRNECTRKTQPGDSISMEYTGTLYSDGTQFDSSVGRAPFDFTLGQGQVIKGWDSGLTGMCVGDKRKLVIPSGLGYGDRGSPPKIPGGATLVFEVELLANKSA